MRNFLLFVMALLPITHLDGQETSTKPPFSAPVVKKSQIIFPIIPVLDEKQIQEEDQPTPSPKRLPKFVSDLSEETWLVIESADQIVVTSSPLGHVTVQAEEGPVKVRGKFADGTGKIETRIFSSKYLYFINAIKQGKIEILIFQPSVVTEEKDIPRYTLNVMGVAPIPPPDPDPKPGPEPDPVPPEPEKSENVRVCIVEDVMNRNPDTAKVLNSLVGWTEFGDKGNQYRLYDKSTQEPAGLTAIADIATVPLPAMVVYDLKSGKKLTATALPGSFSGFKTIVEGLVK